VTRGDLRGGHSACDESAEVSRRGGERLVVVVALTSLVEVERLHGEGAQATAHAREMMSVALQVGQGVDDARYATARLLAAESRFEEAEPLARAASGASTHAADTAALSQALLAWTLAERGREAEARAAIDTAEATLAGKANRDARNQGALLVARARLALHGQDRLAVAKAMSALEEEARGVKYMVVAVEAGLLSAVARHSSRDLWHVEQEAHELGLESIANEARARQ
jgi:hypothetical protein